MLSVVALWASVASAQSGSEIGDRPFGLGIVLGDPSGLSAKLYLGGTTNAVDFALSFDTYGNRFTQDSVYFHATYLWHPSVVAEGNGVVLPWHVGVGGFIGTNPFYETLGVRVPVGLDANLTAVPVQIFGDVGLRVGVIPDTYLDFDVGLGARYYF
jgi:hypothetical protein